VAEERYCVWCVECGTREVVPPSVVYCPLCLPVTTPEQDAEEAAREAAYYAANPDKVPSQFPDDPGSVGGI